MTSRGVPVSDETPLAPVAIAASAEGRLARPNVKACARQMPTPEVTAETDESGVVCLRPTTAENPGAWRAAFLAVFGTDDANVAEQLYQQLLALLRPDPSKPLCAPTANLALSLLRGLAPQDEIEALLCIQMLGCHLGAIATMQRALRADQPMHAQHAYYALAGKLMRTFTQQLDALNRVRGKSTAQKVVVERVTIETGAQAAVGAITGAGGTTE
jgi:hypothetical protein